VRPSDWELVARCKTGETAAFQDLIERYQEKIFMLALGIVHNRDDALEIAQETFFRAYRRIGGFKGESAFYTWLYRIAVNLSFDLQRSRERNPIEFREGIGEALSEQRENTSGPTEELENKELRTALFKAIDGLTPEHKTVVILKTIEGLSYKEIGEIVGCSEGTVMSRLFYARKKLQEKLARFYGSRA
jgi:RNA polymerase sigma-70 factor (ECF subfamily)